MLQERFFPSCVRLSRLLNSFVGYYRVTPQSRKAEGDEASFSRSRRTWSPDASVRDHIGLAKF